MAQKKKPPKKPAHRPAETFKSDLPFEDAIRKALGKKRPEGGWPKPTKSDESSDE